MADLRIGYQLPDEVRIRLGLLVGEFTRLLAARDRQERTFVTLDALYG